MALGLFASLIIGLILRQVGIYSGFATVELVGDLAQLLMGPAIGAGVAWGAGAPPLALFGAITAGAIGAGTVILENGAPAGIMIGEPVGALVAAWVGAELGKLVAGRTRLDIVVVPGVTVLAGGAAGIAVAPAVAAFMTQLGELINFLTGLYPVPMGALVAVVMGMTLTAPVSSAALSISLGISGLAAGAATVGCATQMVGFAVSSYRENKAAGLLAQGVGTSMLQFPNIVRRPVVWVPTIVSSAVIGPLATTVFQMENNAIGAGMGTAGFVGQIATLEVMGRSGIPGIVVLHLLLPAVLTLLVSEAMRKHGLIRFGDLRLDL